jgi:large subunit ribosomal protein L10
MPKPQKIEAVNRLEEKFRTADAALIAEFTGLKVGEMTQLRRKLAENGTDFNVVKNTLGRIAATRADLLDLVPLLRGSTAVAFVKGDPVLAAKGLDEIAKKFPALVVKGGILSGRVLDAAQTQALATVEPREVLLAQLAGLLRGPIQELAGLLQAPLGALANVLNAYRDKLAEGSAQG